MSERLELVARPVEPVGGFEKRRNHIDDLTFTGFTKENNSWFREHGIQSGEWTKEAIAAIGLPVDNVQQVIFTNNTKENPNTMGSWGVGGEEIGRLRLYKLLNEIPPIAQVGTMSHELAHANTPFREENNDLYGSEEARQEAAAHAKAVATQTIATRVFLNPYHKDIFSRYAEIEAEFGPDSKKTKAARELFNEETHAIMVQLRFENPKHLAQVEEAQHASLERRKGAGENVPQAVNIVDGVNKTLVALIAEVDDVESLEDHINDVRTRFAQEDRGKDSFKIRYTITSRQAVNLPKAA